MKRPKKERQKNALKKANNRGAKLRRELLDSIDAEDRERLLRIKYGLHRPDRLSREEKKHVIRFWTDLIASIKR